MVVTHRERPPRGPGEPEARTAIAFLHSRAGDEQEVLPFLTEIDPEARHLGLMPLGPLASTPEGRHWYEIEREASPEPPTFLPSLAALSTWFDETLAERRVAPDRTVLAGFSQGAAMAYALGLAPGRPRPAAILAFAGYIPRVEGFDLDLADRAGLPVLIAHGVNDATVRVEFAREARDRFEAAGLAVHLHEDGGEHEITAAAFARARAFLEETLG